MRDWNKYVQIHIGKYGEFWSYLWGIETIVNIEIVAGRLRFDLTYEGLKPVCVAI